MSKEHDITKGMLEQIRLRGLNVQENVEEIEMDADVDTNIDNDPNNGVVDLSSQEYQDEQSKFMDIVSPNVEFGPFKIYPNNNNAVFSGKLDNGIEWQFSKVDGLYVNMPNIKIDDDIIELMKKLNAHFVNWSKEWGSKLNTEYKGDGEI